LYPCLYGLRSFLISVLLIVGVFMLGYGPLRISYDILQEEKKDELMLHVTAD